MSDPDSGIDRHTLVADVMSRWPATIGVFLERRMLCVGCAIGPYHTVADACREHELDEDEVLRDLRAAALTQP